MSVRFFCLCGLSSDFLLFEDYGFDGYSNAINLKREYYQEFACEFSLNYYPFDTQVCHMVFSLQGFTKEFVIMQQDGIGVEYTGGRVGNYMILGLLTLFRQEGFTRV